MLLCNGASKKSIAASTHILKGEFPHDGHLALHQLLLNLDKTKKFTFVNSSAFHKQVFKKLSKSSRAFLNSEVRNIKGDERKNLRAALVK